MSGDEVHDRVAKEVVRGFALYGSIEHWPTLSLLPNQASLCADCKHPRVKHRYRSGELLDCKIVGCKCECFHARR